MVTRLDLSVPSSDVRIDARLRQRPQINFARIALQTRPTPVDVGIYTTYSLPISNFGADDEYILFTHSVPRRWNGASDILYGITTAIADANSSKKFSIRLDWEHFSSGSVIPATFNSCSCEITVGTSAAQYTTYPATFTIDYDIDGAGNEIKAGDILAGRVGRVAASETEASGEILVFGHYLDYRRDKIGSSWS